MAELTTGQWVMGQMARMTIYISWPISNGSRNVDGYLGHGSEPV